MPIPVTLKKRTFTLNDTCSKVFNLFFDVLKENGCSLKNDSDVLSSVSTSTEIPVPGTLNKLKRVFEDLCAQRVGGREQSLPESTVEMDESGNVLFTAYGKYWGKLMAGPDQLKEKALISEKSGDPNELIMELHLRLAMQALHVDGELKLDQDRQLFIKILSRFSAKLSENGMLNGKLQGDLFSQHAEWLKTLANAVNYIDTVGKIASALKQNSVYLQLLEKKIQQYLILVLTKYGLVSQTAWSSKLADNRLHQTLEEVETKLISIESTKAKQITDSIQGNSPEFGFIAGKTSEVHFWEDLVANEILTAEKAMNQKIIIVLRKEEKPEIENLYVLLNKTKSMRQFLTMLDGLMLSGGFLPFLFGIVKLDELEEIITGHANSCDRIFKQLTPKDHFFSTPLGIEFRQSSCDAIRETSFPKLTILQNSELVRELFLWTKSVKIEQLTKLGKLIGCKVACNPFPEESNKTRSDEKARTHSFHVSISPTQSPRTSVPMPLTRHPNTGRGRSASTDSREQAFSKKKVSRTLSNTTSPLSFHSSPLSNDPRLSNGNVGTNKREDIFVKNSHQEKQSEDIRKNNNISTKQVIKSEPSPIIPESKKVKFKVDYIETFINSVGGVTEDKMRSASGIFSDQPHYFKRKSVSAFCCRVREITQSFMPQLSREKPLGVDNVWRYRQDEVTVLQYFCVEAAQLGDDNHLINFISAMVEMTEEAIFWTDYNKLKSHLKALLTAQRLGEISAFCMLKNDSLLSQERLALLNENSTLRAESEKLSRSVEELQTENKKLQNENEGLRQQNFAITRNFALELENLKKQMEAQRKEIEEIKKGVNKDSESEKHWTNSPKKSPCTLF